MKPKLTKPVREILPSSYSYRGQVSSSKIGRASQYESSLERDMLHLLEFDNCVEFYCEQPVTIEYVHAGVVRHYTPDILAYYRDDLEASATIKPTLYEVKYRADLWRNWAELKPRFMAALRYADQQGWRFKLLTEREIRTDYLTNIQFLRQYIGPGEQVFQVDQHLLMTLLRDVRLTTGEELLLMATDDRTKRAELLYTMWTLIAVGLIRCDLTRKLSLKTELWIA